MFGTAETQYKDQRTIYFIIRSTATTRQIKFVTGFGLDLGLSGWSLGVYFGFIWLRISGKVQSRYSLP